MRSKPAPWSSNAVMAVVAFYVLVTTRYSKILSRVFRRSGVSKGSSSSNLISTAVQHLPVIDPDTATVTAETPPIGHSNAWLNPAGIADFNGDGATDIALVRQPHVIGRLELWSWMNGKLKKTAEVEDVSNHVIGSRALGMSSIGDFDGDGRPDLAVPSLDRRMLRLIAFTPQPHDIARVSLPARVASSVATIIMRGRLAAVFGLDNGQLILVHD